jgi:hypothetical protein
MRSLNFGIAHDPRAEHRMATVVVVDAGLARFIDQNFGGETRGSFPPRHEHVALTGRGVG